MVREGKLAEVTACREAEVKSPVPGHPRMPVEGVVADGMATSRRVREAGEIPLAPVQEGGQPGRVSEARIQNASLEIRMTEKMIPNMNMIHVERNVHKAEMVESVQEKSPVPMTGKKPEQMTPGIIEKAVSPLRDTQPVRADSSLTLAQLFSDTSIFKADGKQASDKKEI